MTIARQDGRCDVGMMTWTLLIYTVPSEPSRLRATVWRELKKAGAVYLRDGVCALPARPETTEALRAIAARVEEFGGRAFLVEEARFDPARAHEIVDRANAARAEEYAEVAREAEAFLAHVEREREHREFAYAEVEELEADLGKIKRWIAQIRARDHFGADGSAAVEDLVTGGDAALAAFLDEAYRQTEETGS
jgi:hypothetical protein